jgi:hypothetical protein
MAAVSTPFPGMIAMNTIGTRKERMRRALGRRPVHVRTEQWPPLGDPFLLTLRGLIGLYTSVYRAGHTGDVVGSRSPS